MEFRQPQKLALTPSTPSAIDQKYATQKTFQSHTHQLGRNAHTITNPHTTMAKPETRKYPHPTDKLFNAALMVVRELGYKIDTIDKVNGLLNFKTGMSWKSFAGQEMSVLVLDNGDGTCSVDIAGKRAAGGPHQLIDWGEAGSIARKVFDKIEERLR